MEFEHIKYNSDEINLKNSMEEMVFNYIDRLIKNSQYCKCPLCRMDIAAYALNSLPPKYVVTKKGELYSKASQLDHQFDTDLIIAVMKAIKVVGRNPRHSIQEGEISEK